MGREMKINLTISFSNWMNKPEVSISDGRDFYGGHYRFIYSNYYMPPKTRFSMRFSKWQNIN